MLSAPIVHIQQTASLYSQIAGVLAGFAFTGILIYLGPTEDRLRGGSTSRLSQASRGTVVVLVSTLGALVLCAILYAVLAGGPDQSPASSTGILINGLTFSLAILSMFYAIGLAALPHAHLDAMLRVVRIMAGVIGPLVAMLLIASAVLDICTLYPTACNPIAYYLPNHPFGFGALLAGILLVACALTAVLAGAGREAPPTGLPAAVSALVLGTAVLGIAASVVLGGFPEDYVMGHEALFVFEAISFCLLQCFAILAILSCRPLVRDAHSDAVVVPAQPGPHEAVRSEATSGP